MNNNRPERDNYGHPAPCSFMIVEEGEHAVTGCTELKWWTDGICAGMDVVNHLSVVLYVQGDRVNIAINLHNMPNESWKVFNYKDGSIEEVFSGVTHEQR